MRFPRLPSTYKKMLEARSLEFIQQLLRQVSILMIVVPFLFAAVMFLLGMLRQTVDDVRLEKVAAQTAEVAKTQKKEADQREEKLREDLVEARAQAGAATRSAEEAKRKAGAIEEAGRDRQLTAAQKQGLRSAMARFAGAKLIIQSMGNDAEAGWYAEQIAKVMQEAGLEVVMWSVARTRPVDAPEPEFIVHINKDQQMQPPAIADALLTEFERIGSVAGGLQDGLARDQVALFVGAKPASPKK